MSGRNGTTFKRAIWAGVAILGLGAVSLSAQVLDQVPSDAVGVLEVKNLQDVNQKTAKIANAWGLDEWQPDFKDPLAALMKQCHISKGVNTNGDMAVAMVTNNGNLDDPQALALIPVSDYGAFLGNFEKVGDADGGVQEIKNPQSGSNLFVAQRGNYAALCPIKALLQKHADGLKLEGPAAAEAKAKDAILFINIPALQKEILPHMAQGRQEFLDAFSKGFEAQPQMQQYAPLAKSLGGKMFDAAEQFIKDSRGIMISVNLGQQGILFSGLGQFAGDSRWGSSVSKLQNTKEPLLAGLPEHKYFAFGGMAWDPKSVSEIWNPILDSIHDSLANSQGQAKEMAGMIDVIKSSIASTNRMAAGYVVPEGGGFLQQVQVLTGNAQVIDQNQRKIIETYGNMMAAPGAGITMKIKPGEPKEVEGVKLNTFEMSVEADQNNPQAMQARMIMQMFYGGPTITTVSGPLNPNTYLMVQGGNDDFLKQAVAAAKGNKDVLGTSQLVANVSKELPQQRFCEEYVSLDNIIARGVQIAQNFGLPFQVKVPADLPPLGFTIGSDGPSIRGDMYVPSQTVQSLIAAGLQAAQQAQKGGKGAL